MNTSKEDQVNGPIGQALWQRADAVIPAGGIYLTRSARFAGRDVMPGFIKQASGCRIIDADDKSYLDFNCGNGPSILGYCHKAVDQAAQRQATDIDLASFFPVAMVEYAERLVKWSETFDWSILVKNGSDATNLSMRLMRSKRQQPYIVLFESAYHGFGPELALHPETKSDAGQRNIIRLPWNDVEALQDLAKSKGSQVAGIMMNALDQSPVQKTVEATPEFIAALETFRADTGALITLDDVRHGFRLHPKGSHHFLGFEPDLLCVGKALGNGYALAAVLAKESLRAAAEQVQLTATYMFSSVAFRAGIAMLDTYENEDVFNHLNKMGQKLVDGFMAIAAETGHTDLCMSGPVTMPTFLLLDDKRIKRSQIFARQASLNGAIFHPTLNWFISYAHKSADIDEALDIARVAFLKTPTSI